MFKQNNEINELKGQVRFESSTLIKSINSSRVLFYKKKIKRFASDKWLL